MIARNINQSWALNGMIKIWMSWFLALLLANNAMADARIDTDVVQNGIAMNYAMYVQADKVRIVDQRVGGDDILFDTAKSELLVINHADQSYMRIDQKRIGELVQLLESAAELARSQGGVLGDLMKTFGLDNELGKKEEVSYRHLGTIEQIAGTDCEVVHAYQNEEVQTELCIAKQLPISQQDAETLNGFMRFSHNLVSRAGSVISQLGLAIPTLPKSEIGGIPLDMKSLKDQTTARVSRISSGAVTPDLFKVPAGYQQTELPLG